MPDYPGQPSSPPPKVLSSVGGRTDAFCSGCHFVSSFCLVGQWMLVAVVTSLVGVDAESSFLGRNSSRCLPRRTRRRRRCTALICCSRIQYDPTRGPGSLLQSRYKYNTLLDCGCRNLLVDKLYGIYLLQCSSVLMDSRDGFPMI